MFLKTGGRDVAVKLCIDLKVRCLYRRVDLRAVDFVLNGRVRKEGVGNVLLAELEDGCFVKFVF